MGNSNLHKAKIEKNDEFYTRYEDIEEELKNYPVECFKDKVIYCPCDMPSSNFVKYFENNKERLGYKKLIHTSIQEGFDYRSEYCQRLFEEAEVVVTNPPFSLFRDFVATLESHNLKYILWGNNNAITYKEIFPLLKQGNLFLGYLSNKTCNFRVGEGYTYDEKETAKINDGSLYGKVPAISVFTNFDLAKHHEELLLTKKYDQNSYPNYFNFDAIEISKVKDIPCDYDGIMGVPITFLDKHNPEQFEIIGLGIATLGLECGVKPYLPKHKEYRKKVQNKHIADGDLYMLDEEGHPVVPYARILIRRKQK